MCDDSFDDFDDGFEGDDFGDDDDFGPPSIDAGSNNDDCLDGMDWHDFTLGVGFGYEMSYGERRRRRTDMDEF